MRWLCGAMLPCCVDDLESDFIWRIWWSDDSTKYRKIAPLLLKSILQPYGVL